MQVSQLSESFDAVELDPLRVYERLRGSRTYILESAEGGEKVARYSFIGVDPVLVVEVRGGSVSFEVGDDSLDGILPEEGNPLSVLRQAMGELVFAGESAARFTGGLVGFLSYDLVRSLIALDDDKPDVLNHPDAAFMLSRVNVIFDHVEGRVHVVANAFGDGFGVAQDALADTVEAVLDLPLERGEDSPVSSRVDIDYSSNFTEKEYMSAVRKAKEYIKAGDIFQVVPSQRLTADYKGDPLSVNRVLKKINPSPYMYYLDFGERQVVGSSPEMLARVEGLQVSTYPIAGTRPRGRTLLEDRRLAEEMLADGKERAEHVMLVDLGRNDVGRVAEYGSVSVDKFMVVEKFSHVQHIVSEVTGKLRGDCDRFDALASIFPAGTVSGAPKVRAMEVIEELEPDRRGVYAGCVGYFSFEGNMDTAITIRTAVFEGGRAHVQAGGGVVADSQPEREFQETLNKAEAMLRALASYSIY